MAFGSESTNPRERRAYAHTILDKARRSGLLEDFVSAKRAVSGASQTEKGIHSGFVNALANAALSDTPTRILVEKAKEVLDPEKTPRKVISTLSVGKHLASARRYSQDFDLVHAEGSAMGRTEIIDMNTGEVGKFTVLRIIDHAGDRVAHRVPTTTDGEVDALAIRVMPDQLRSMLAQMAAPIETLEPKPYVDR